MSTDDVFFRRAYTPYQYAGNQPIIDIDGLESNADIGQQIETEAKSDTTSSLASTVLTPPVVISPTAQRLHLVVLLPILQKLLKDQTDSDIITEDDKYKLDYYEYVELSILGEHAITGSPGNLNYRIAYFIDDLQNDFNSFTPYKKLIEQFEEGTLSKYEFLLSAKELLKVTQRENEGSNYTVFATIRDFKQNE